MQKSIHKFDFIYFSEANFVLYLSTIGFIPMYTFHRDFLHTHWPGILVIAAVLLPLFFLWCLHLLNSKKPCNDLDFSVQFQLIVIDGRWTTARWSLWFDLKPVSFVILISSGMEFCSHEQVKKGKRERKSLVTFPWKWRVPLNRERQHLWNMKWYQKGYELVRNSKIINCQMHGHFTHCSIRVGESQGTWLPQVHDNNS